VTTNSPAAALSTLTPGLLAEIVPSWRTHAYSETAFLPFVPGVPGGPDLPIDPSAPFLPGTPCGPCGPGWPCGPTALASRGAWNPFGVERQRGRASATPPVGRDDAQRWLPLDTQPWITPLDDFTPPVAAHALPPSATNRATVATTFA
jgi:hypothetical protein